MAAVRVFAAITGQDITSLCPDLSFCIMRYSRERSFQTIKYDVESYLFRYQNIRLDLEGLAGLGDTVYITIRRTEHGDLQIVDFLVDRKTKGSYYPVFF